jgi:deoxycytidylate deaminase
MSLAIASQGSTAPSERSAITLGDRQTDELVIALVGAIGSGSTTTAALLKEVMEREYKYSTNYIRISNIIRSAATEHKIKIPPKDSKGEERISGLQEAGNELRKRFSSTYLADKVVENIAVDRKLNSGYHHVGDDKDPLPLPRRRVHIVDSLKHPDEVGLLRDVYGDTFWLIGVFSPEIVRSSRLKSRDLSSTEIIGIMERDESDGLSYGQKVRDTIHHADFFLRNDGQNNITLKGTLDRFLKILFNIGVNTPTRDETAMDKATAQASNSACMSRQVGAAIYSRSGELIGIGANDVPKSNGGLYCTEDGQNDHRCFKWLQRECHNDKKKKTLYADIHAKLSKAKLIDSDISLEDVEAALKQTDVKNLIEYSRAVHAEMEAIISVARAGKAGLVGSTLYSTTYPCHGCARHAVAAGISRVIYIEPYAKSLAIDLHGDAISLTEIGNSDKMVFLQYEGVAPKNMIRLFKHGRERKMNGKIVVHDMMNAHPVFPAPLDGFSTREKIVLNRIEANTGKKSMLSSEAEI